MTVSATASYRQGINVATTTNNTSEPNIPRTKITNLDGTLTVGSRDR